LDIFLDWMFMMLVDTQKELKESMNLELESNQHIFMSTQSIFSLSLSPSLSSFRSIKINSKWLLRINEEKRHTT
jgi:hypothetical protein